MTIKEIAELTGKAERTIREWTTLAKTAGVSAKTADAMKTKKPADFTLDEIIEILKAGNVSESLIFILKENALSKNIPEPVQNKQVETSSKIDRLELLVEKLITSIPAMITQTIKQLQPIQNQPKQIEFIQDYFSILAFCKNKNIIITFSEALKFGKEAAKLSRNKNQEIRKIPDERFGEVGSYHIDILNEVFKI